jgi:protease I
MPAPSWLKSRLHATTVIKRSRFEVKKAVILTWSGFQDHELVYPYYRLLGAGYEVKIVSDKRDELGRTYGIFGLNMPCHMNYQEFYNEADEILSSWDLLLLPGGVKSLEKLRQETEAIAFVTKWNETGKVISSTCHGAQLLISARIVEGRTIAGYYSIGVDIENAGAHYSKEPVVVSGNIVSSPHYDHMGIWMETTLAEVEAK